LERSGKDKAGHSRRRTPSLEGSISHVPLLHLAAGAELNAPIATFMAQSGKLTLPV